MRKPKTRNLKDAPLNQQLTQLGQQHPRYGYHRIHALVCRTSAGTEKVNIKRVHRLWKEAGHQVPPRKKRRPHRGKGQVKGQVKALQQALYPGHAGNTLANAEG